MEISNCKARLFLQKCYPELIYNVIGITLMLLVAHNGGGFVQLGKLSNRPPGIEAKIYN